MIIIGVDYHPSDQYVAFVDTETGECGERRLTHSDGEAEKFYRDLKLRGVSVRVGMEATGYSRWFERLLAELGIDVWIGDAWGEDGTGFHRFLRLGFDRRRTVAGRITFLTP